MPRGLCPAQTIFMSACGRGESLQSDIWKYWPLKSDEPFSHSSRRIVTYSVL